jgi:hypothetical protein
LIKHMSKRYTSGSCNFYCVLWNNLFSRLAGASWNHSTSLLLVTWTVLGRRLFFQSWQALVYLFSFRLTSMTIVMICSLVYKLCCIFEYHLSINCD